MPQANLSRKFFERFKVTEQRKSVMDEFTTAQLLGAIDERTRNTADTMVRMDKKFDVFAIGTNKRLTSVEKSVEALSPVKRIVFAGIGIILGAFLVAVIALIMTRPGVVK